MVVEGRVLLCVHILKLQREAAAANAARTLPN